MNEQLMGVFAPAALMLVLAIGGLRLTATGARHAMLGIGAAAAFALACSMALHGLPFPPRETGHWIPILAAAGALGGLLAGVLPEAGAWAVRILLSAGVAWVLTAPRRQHAWKEGATAWIWLLALTLLLAGGWALWDRLARRPGAMRFGTATGLAAGLCAIIFLFAGGARDGQISGALGLILGVVALAGFVWHGRTVGPGLAGAGAVGFFALLVNMTLYAELPPAAALCAWAAPLVVAAWPGEDERSDARFGETLRFLFRSAFLTLPLVIISGVIMYLIVKPEWPF